MSFLEKNKYWLIWLGVCAVGAWLKFANLALKPLWIDEVLFYHFSTSFSWSQEIVPILISKILGVGSDWTIRFPFALFGFLTVPAVFLVFGKKSWPLALFIAVFPLFTFWSRMARPYTMAGLFIVLAWRWPLAYLPAIFCTPFSILGLNFKRLFTGKDKKYWIIGYGMLIVSAYGLFMLRLDTHRNFWDIHFLTTASRLWYIPALSLCLHGWSLIKEKVK